MLRAVILIILSCFLILKRRISVTSLIMVLSIVRVLYLPIMCSSDYVPIGTYICMYMCDVISKSDRTVFHVPVHVTSMS
jgi:hypothetical protein